MSRLRFKVVNIFEITKVTFLNLLKKKSTFCVVKEVPSYEGKSSENP
jgi:hypothetical protein